MAAIYRHWTSPEANHAVLVDCVSSRSLLPVCRLGKTDPKLLMRRARDVPENDREKMFWIPDRELLEAWLKLHDVHGKGLGKQPFPPSDDYPMKVK